MTIATLITRVDAAEVVRDQIAQLLADESAAQQALATAAAENPELWRLRVYRERSTPWETFTGEAPIVDTAPVINVMYQGSDFPDATGGAVDCQTGEATYNIDCYGYGASSSDGGAGQVLGDEQAALAVQRATRLVRSVLMAGEYTYLGLRGTVFRRWVESVRVFQPEERQDAVYRVVGARVVLGVRLQELSPQVEGVTLESLGVELRRASDGQVLASATYSV